MIHVEFLENGFSIKMQPNLEFLHIRPKWFKYKLNNYFEFKKKKKTITTKWQNFRTLIMDIFC